MKTNAKPKDGQIFSDAISKIVPTISELTVSPKKKKKKKKRVILETGDVYDQVKASDSLKCFYSISKIIIFILLVIILFADYMLRIQTSKPF